MPIIGKPTPLVKTTRNLPSHISTAKCYVYQNFELPSVQEKCIERYKQTIQLEQELYLAEHPEVKEMMKMYMGKAIQAQKRKDHLGSAAKYFTRPELEKEVRESLRMRSDQSTPTKNKSAPEYEYLGYRDPTLISDLHSIIQSRNTMPLLESEEASSSDTESSSFISIITSDTTFETPEATPLVSPTISQIFYQLISNIVDKATLVLVKDDQILYDTAYVEVMKAVENAMETTVIDIKNDINVLINTAIHNLNIIIGEKEKIIADLNWKRRMRKKLKKTIRRMDNFTGYVTPPTPKSVLSSHESYKIPPPSPCECHPQCTYNRYPKDRFGIYLPQKTEYSRVSITGTPIMSLLSLSEEDAENESVGPKRTSIKYPELKVNNIATGPANIAQPTQSKKASKDVSRVPTETNLQPPKFVETKDDDADRLSSVLEMIQPVSKVVDESDEPENFDIKKWACDNETEHHPIINTTAGSKKSLQGVPEVVKPKPTGNRRPGFSEIL